MNELDRLKKEERPCNIKELLEMLKKQGMQLLIFKDSGFMYSVVKITDDEVTFTSDVGAFSYTYKELCEYFTLLDGSELWIKEHTKKTWLEEYLNISCDDKIEAHNSKIDIENVCKKILEEVKVKNLNLSFGNKINYFALKDIIKDLGVDL